MTRHIQPPFITFISLRLQGIGKPKPRALSDGASGSGGNSRPPSGAAGEGRDGSPLAADEAAGMLTRTP